MRIRQKPIEIDDESDRAYHNSDDAEGEYSDYVEIKPPPRTDRCRSLSTIPDKLQGLVPRMRIMMILYASSSSMFLRDKKEEDRIGTRNLDPS